MLPPLPPLGSTSSSSNAIWARATGPAPDIASPRLVRVLSGALAEALPAALVVGVLAAAGFFAGLTLLLRAGVAPAFFLVVVGAILAGAGDPLRADIVGGGAGIARARV